MFFSGLFQRKSDAPVTTPAELADAIGLSYDTYTGNTLFPPDYVNQLRVFAVVNQFRLQYSEESA